MARLNSKRRISPLTYTAFIGLFPYDQSGFSARLKKRVIVCNFFYFAMSMSCRIARIIQGKPSWSTSIFMFFRVFVYVAIQIFQIIYLGVHLQSVFKNRRALEGVARASTRVPRFFRAVTYIDIVYTLTMCIMFIYRCLVLEAYFGIWNTITITIQNHFSLQITMLFSFFLYNFTKRHEMLTRMLPSSHPSQVPELLKHHFKLMKRLESLNRIYARPILFMYGDIFISLAFYSYYMTTMEGAENQWLSYVLNSLLLAQRLTMLFSTSFIAERLMASADTFNMALYVKMKSNQDLYTTKLLRLYIICPKTIKLSACGFFELGNDLVTSMAGAVVTYLVALVQLSE